MAKSNDKEAKIILLIFIIFSILALLIVFMLIKNGLLFHTKIRFDHEPITYSIEPNLEADAKVCSDAQVERIDQAFETIQSETQRNVIFLKVLPGKEDISLYCSDIENGNLTYFSNSTFKVATFTVTEAQSQFSHKGNIIKKGIITFYPHRNCGTWPDVEIHEILHALGFVHTDDKTSIMYPISLICDRDKIDEWIIKDLIETYS